MNMSTNHSTKKSLYSHLSASERGEISAYLKMGKTPSEIARLLGHHHSTISREIKRGSVSQVQDKNGKWIYSTIYFPDSGQRVYETNRQKVPIINYRTAPGPSSRNLRKSWKRSLVVTVSIALFKLTEKNIHWKLSLPPRQCIVTSKTDCWGLNRLIYLRWWVSENGLK